LALLLYIQIRIMPSCHVTAGYFIFTWRRLRSSVIRNVTSCSLVGVQPSFMTSRHFTTMTPHIWRAECVCRALLGFGISHDSEIWESFLSRDAAMTQNGAMYHKVSSSSVTYIVCTKMAEALLRTPRKSGKYKLQ